MPSRAPATVDEMLARGFEGLDGSLEQRVQELADREEIRELIARYAQQVVRRQSMAHMFTADGALIVRLPGFPVHEVRGHAALDKLFGSTITSAAMSMPAVHNVSIQVTGDEAIATSWIELHVTNDADSDGRAFAGSGTYDDRLRRENGRWKFVMREANVRVVGAVQRAKPIVGD
jgi:SnoaL-like domain